MKRRDPFEAFALNFRSETADGVRACLVQKELLRIVDSTAVTHVDGVTAGSRRRVGAIVKKEET